MLLRVVLGLLVLPAFVVAKDAGLDHVAGHHCLAPASVTARSATARRALGDLCLDVAPAGRRTHLGTRLLAGRTG